MKKDIITAMEKCISQYTCKYCGRKTPNSCEICGNCSHKLNLVFKLIHIGKEIKKACKKG